MNSHQKRKVKRAHLKVQRKAELKLEAEHGRKKASEVFANTPAIPESERFKENPTMDELFEYMKEVHLRH